MLNDYSEIKKLHFIISSILDCLIIIVIALVIILPMKTHNKIIRFTGLGCGVITLKLGFKLLADTEKLDKQLSGKNYLEEDSLLNQIATLKALNEQYYQNQLQPTLNYQNPPIQETFEEEPVAPSTPFEVYNWVDCIDEAVGFIVSGNSGSGKTSVACWLAGLLTQEKPAQVLALDPHYNDTWEQINITSIGKIEEIERILTWLLNELNNRCELKSKKLPLGDDLIVFCDEVNACLERFENPKKITSAIKRLGSEGRKFGITFIILNQSHNATDLDVSEKYLNNYFIIGLCASARAIINSNFKQTPEKDYIKSIAYPCVVSGSVPVQIALHPTHHSYSKFKKHGNPPLNLIPIKQLPLLIGSQPTTHILKPTTHTTTNTEKIDSEKNVGNYPHHQIINYLDNCWETEYQQITNGCPHCDSLNIIKWGKDRKKCNDCNKTFKV